MAKIGHFLEWIQSKIRMLKAVTVGVSFPRPILGPIFSPSFAVKDKSKRKRENCYS